MAGTKEFWNCRHGGIIESVQIKTAAENAKIAASAAANAACNATAIASLPGALLCWPLTARKPWRSTLRHDLSLLHAQLSRHTCKQSLSAYHSAIVLASGTNYLKVVSVKSTTRTEILPYYKDFCGHTPPSCICVTLCKRDFSFD